MTLTYKQGTPSKMDYSFYANTEIASHVYLAFSLVCAANYDFHVFSYECYTYGYILVDVISYEVPCLVFLYTLSSFPLQGRVKLHHLSLLKATWKERKQKKFWKIFILHFMRFVRCNTPKELTRSNFYFLCLAFI